MTAQKRASPKEPVTPRRTRTSARRLLLARVLSKSPKLRASRPLLAGGAKALALRSALKSRGAARSSTSRAGTQTDTATNDTTV